MDSKAPPGELEGDAEPLENWADQPDSAAYKRAITLYPKIKKCYENKTEQADRIEEYWNIFNAMPDENLQYAGNSQGYVPAVRDAIHARVKRALKQLFPANHKHVDGLSDSGKPPYTQLSLLEHYIRKCKLKSIMRSVLIAADVTGQNCVGIDWSKSKRRVTELVRRNPIIEQIDGEDTVDLGLEDMTVDEDEDLEQYDVIEEGPEIFDFAVEDLAVYPPTENDLQKAARRGAVGLRLRYSPDKIKEMVDEGVFILPPNTEIEEFCKGETGGNNPKAKKSPDKRATEDAGIKTAGTDKYALLFMIYSMFDFGDVDDEGEPIRTSGIAYFAGESEIVGLIRNPLWSGRVPLISSSIQRIKGSHFGISKIEPVKFMQWNCCDAWNMGQDSMLYSLLPITAVNPLNAPNWQTLVFGLGAIWPIAPDQIKTIPFPQLWEKAYTACEGMKKQIWESMEVSEMMLGRMPQGRKNNQLMGAMQQDQMINISDHAEEFEETVLNELVEFLFEFDQQYRTEEITIEARGEIGVKAALEVIPVPQWHERFFFRWSGTTYQQNMQRLQQGIGAMNVINGVPPQLLNGRRLDVTPILEALVENIFGPELAPRILIDERNMFTVDPEIENQIMVNDQLVDVHEADDHQVHLQSHMREANLSKDPLGLFRQHMMAHMEAIKRAREKQMAAQAAAQPKGVPGSPGGGAPGAPGAPRPGALPAPGGPRPAQNPPGAIQQDNMPGAPGRG